MNFGNHSQPLDLAYLQINSVELYIRDTVNNLDLPVGSFNDFELRRFDSNVARHRSYLGGQGHTDAARRTGNYYSFSGKIDQIRNLENYFQFVTGGVPLSHQVDHEVIIQQEGIPFFGLNNYPLPRGKAVMTTLPDPTISATASATGGSGWTPATLYVVKVEALYSPEGEDADGFDTTDLDARRSAGDTQTFTITNATDKVTVTLAKPVLNGNNVRSQGWAVWIKTDAAAATAYALVAITDNPDTLSFVILAPTALASSPSPHIVSTGSLIPTVRYGANFATVASTSEMIWSPETIEIRRGTIASPVPEAKRVKLEYAYLNAPRNQSDMGTVNPSHGYQYLKFDERGSDNGSDQPAAEGLVIHLWQAKTDIADAQIPMTPDKYSEGFTVTGEAVLARYPSTGYGRIYGSLDAYKHLDAAGPDVSEGAIGNPFSGGSGGGTGDFTGGSLGQPFGG